MDTFHDPELAATAEPIELPARILVQIRDGIPNLLRDGTVRSFAQADPTPEDAAAGAKVKHTVAIGEVIDLLGRALSSQIVEWYETAPPEEHPIIDDWLAQLRDAIFRARA